MNCDPVLRAIDAAELRRVLGHLASGVTVLAAVRGEEPVGMTCQSLFSQSLDPPLIAFSPGLHSTTWPRIATDGGLAVSILAATQATLCRGFAVSGADKFAGVEWTPAPVSGSPVIDGCHAWLDCEIASSLVVGDHYLVIARLLAVGSDSSIDLPGPDPLLFHRSRLRTLGAKTE